MKTPKTVKNIAHRLLFIIIVAYLSSPPCRDFPPSLLNIGIRVVLHRPISTPRQKRADNEKYDTHDQTQEGHDAR